MSSHIDILNYHSQAAAASVFNTCSVISEFVSTFDLQ